MTEKFDGATASKQECLDEANRKLSLALRAEENGRPPKMIDMALNLAVKAEALALDGRA